MKIRCDTCGKFISNYDMEIGRAVTKLIYPSSLATREEYLTECYKCINKVLPPSYPGFFKEDEFNE